jgi:hypothetical protein
VRIAKYVDQPWKRFANNRGSDRPDDSDNVPDNQLPGVRYRRLFTGVTGQPGNYEAVILWTPTEDAGRHFPRHRHDFDQLRYTIAGNPLMGPDQPTPPGHIAYTPAGTFYGPYDRHAGEIQIHVQFEGANRAPFVDYDTLVEANLELAKRGTFEKGVYTWIDDNGRRHNMDGNQAAVEQATGRKVEFPAPRFPASVQMDPTSFNWIQLQPGVQQKELGRFTEAETRVAMLRLESGATYQFTSPDQRTLLFVVSGAGTADGEAIEERDGLFAEVGDGGVLSTSGHLELLLLGLPKQPAIQPQRTSGVHETRTPSLVSS